jgi:hypothetical protein
MIHRGHPLITGGCVKGAVKEEFKYNRYLYMLDFSGRNDE